MGGSSQIKDKGIRSWIPYGSRRTVPDQIDRHSSINWSHDVEKLV